MFQSLGQLPLKKCSSSVCIAGGVAGGVLASTGIKSEKREGKPTQDVAGPSSDTASAATTTGTAILQISVFQTGQLCG